MIYCKLVGIIIVTLHVWIGFDTLVILFYTL